MTNKVLPLIPGMPTRSMTIRLSEDELTPKFGSYVHVIFWKGVDEVESMSGEEFYTTFQARLITDYLGKMDDIYFYILKSPDDSSLTRIGNFDVSEVALQHYLSRKGNPFAVYALAISYLKADDQAKSRQGFERVLEICNGSDKREYAEIALEAEARLVELNAANSPV